LVENLPNVRSFSGCFSVDVCFSLDGKEMLLAEQWESVQHHQNYIEYISANGVMQLLRSHLIADPDVNYFEKYSC
jgi:quinol monooxygenase YgiN